MLYQQIVKRYSAWGTRRSRREGQVRTLGGGGGGEGCPPFLVPQAEKQAAVEKFISVETIKTGCSPKITSPGSKWLERHQK